MKSEGIVLYLLEIGSVLSLWRIYCYYVDFKNLCRHLKCKNFIIVLLGIRTKPRVKYRKY